MSSGIGGLDGAERYRKFDLLSELSDGGYPIAEQGYVRKEEWWFERGVPENAYRCDFVSFFAVS